jgi:predicted ATPase
LSELEQQLLDTKTEQLAAAEAAVLNRLWAFRERLSALVSAESPNVSTAAPTGRRRGELARQAELFRARAQSLYISLQELSHGYQDIADAVSTVGEDRRYRQSRRGLPTAYRKSTKRRSTGEIS